MRARSRPTLVIIVAIIAVTMVATRSRAWGMIIPLQSVPVIVVYDDLCRPVSRCGGGAMMASTTHAYGWYQKLSVGTKIERGLAREMCALKTRPISSWTAGIEDNRSRTGFIISWPPVPHSNDRCLWKIETLCWLTDCLMECLVLQPGSSPYMMPGNLCRSYSVFLWCL